MNKQSSESENSQRGDPLSPQRTLAGDALARRRLLLRGATGGASALAALTPLGARAAGTGGSTVLTCTGVGGKVGLCSVSGTNSAAHSFLNVTQVPAGGKKVSWYGSCSGGSCSSLSMTPANAWPTGLLPSTKLKNTTLPWAAGSAYGNYTMLGLLGTRSASAEAHWTVAYLNALKFYPLGTFPYSASQVVDMYNGVFPGVTRDKAYTFFTTYMENLP
ncbi:hypothetical protein [Roseateles violae]|uniref:Uncharacterized protein n=1 Tax=Roseateles violae TaxID=3058042 RepID=A0ABT8DR41_9BURK|nr:hypothetical protein [Pelomonas sp. PFR6]MDN3919515.1 hypothetical protein [Pelomonas sp. PFR6]